MGEESRRERDEGGSEEESECEKRGEGTLGVIECHRLLPEEVRAGGEEGEEVLEDGKRRLGVLRG